MAASDTLPVRNIIEGSVSLTPDNRAVALRELTEVASGFGYLLGLLKGTAPVPKDLAYNILYVAESHIAKLCPLFEVELDSINDRNERYARMRALNAEIRDLKQQLGESGSAEQTQAHVRQSFAKLKNWWRKAGFGHIQDMQVTEYGSIQATFSCSLYGDFYLTGSSTPVSDKENKKLWHAALAGRGFQLGHEPGDREPVLIDCDDSRRALEALFAEAFPSGKMAETTNHYNGRSGDVVLRSVRVIIRDMQDILNLSVPDTSDL